MKFLPTTLAACVLMAAGTASAQYHPYGVPTSVPVPMNSAPMAAGYYDNAHQEAMPVAPEASMGHEDAACESCGDSHSCAGEGCSSCCDSCSGGCSSCGLGMGGGLGLGRMLSWPGYGPCEGAFGNVVGPCNKWYGSASALLMTRDDDDNLHLSFDATNPFSELLCTGSADADYQGGVELTIGRRIGCYSAFELTYWTIDPFNNTAIATDPNAMINTTFDFRSQQLAGRAVTGWFDNARAHMINRRSEFHNLEANFLSGVGHCNACSRLRLGWMSGLRWFRFKDDMLFGASELSTAFNVTPANDIYYDIDVSNDLIGWQIGGRGDYYVSRCLSLFAAPKFGIYHNQITQSQRIYDGVGNTGLDVHTNKSDFSTLAQLDLGVNYQASCRLSVFAGYRVLAATSVATSTGQIPRLLDDLDGIRNIDTNSNILLHGGFAGLSYKF